MFFVFSGGFQHQNFSPILQAQLSSLRVEQIQPSWHEGKPLEYYALFFRGKNTDSRFSDFLRICKVPRFVAEQHYVYFFRPKWLLGLDVPF